MKTQRYVQCVLAFAMLTLAACSSTSGERNGRHSTDSEVYNRYAATCTFKDGETPAPDWICGMPLAEYPITEVGYSATGIEDEAKLNALERLAARINANIDSTSERTVRGSGDRATTAFESTTVMQVSEALRDTRVVLRMTDPSTRGIHVLVVMDEMAFQEAIEIAQERARREPSW